MGGHTLFTSTVYVNGQTRVKIVEVVWSSQFIIDFITIYQENVLKITFLYTFVKYLLHGSPGVSYIWAIFVKPVCIIIKFYISDNF